MPPDGRPAQPGHLAHETLRLFTQTPLPMETDAFEPSTIYLKRYSQFMDTDASAAPVKRSATFNYSHDSTAAFTNAKNSFLNSRYSALAFPDDSPTGSDSGFGSILSAQHYYSHNYPKPPPADAEMMDSHDSDLASAASKVSLGLTHTPTVMCAHSVCAPTVTTDTLAPWEPHPGVSTNNTAMTALHDPDYPGEPVYSEAMRAAMESSPHITMDIWATIYRKNVLNELETLTDYLYKTDKIQGTSSEPGWRAKIKFLEGELVKITYKVNKIDGAADAERLLREREKKLKEQQESERRLSDQRWRTLDNERREQNRKFVEAQLHKMETAKAAKARHVKEMDDAERTIRKERYKLMDLIEAEEAQLLSEAQEAQRMIEEDHVQSPSEDDWQRVKKRWDWMMNDMQETQMREVRQAQQEAMKIAPRPKPVGVTGYRKVGRTVSFADSVRISDNDNNEEDEGEQTMGDELEQAGLTEAATPTLKRARFGSMKQMWRVMKRNKN